MSHYSGIAWTAPPSQHTAPCSVPLFVYGTLRSGDVLDDGRIKSATPRIPGWVRGELHACTEGQWPLLIPGPTGWVRGELLLADATSALWEALGSEEIAWGYELRHLNVYPDPGSAQPWGRALVCVWPWQEYRGGLIESGDWATSGGATQEVNPCG